MDYMFVLCLHVCLFVILVNYLFVLIFVLVCLFVLEVFVSLLVISYGPMMINLIEFFITCRKMYTLA